MQSQISTIEMIKDRKEVRGIFHAHEQKSRAKKTGAALNQQVLLDLSMRLQMSLEVDWIINQFMEYIHSHFMFDGFRYELPEHDIELVQGREKGHTCSYALNIENHKLGQINVFRGRKFAESELVLLENMLCSLLYPLRNAVLYLQASLLAHSDALTGVKNRSTFDQALDREVSLAQRHANNFSVMVIDIDHFKKVNDNYGHSAGDEVLKIVADKIKQSIRTSDMLFRYGGEEFVVFLSNSDCETSHVIADRMLETIRQEKVVYQQHEISVSVSIGLACLNRTDTPESIFNRADDALYSAKEGGRDQIKVA
ncbi:MAG: GGDEF domain-containing protein [Gammaproteobacteria bacterium]|nr:GGDEF domain-containing protein [Gammaproteobacteria bacterium]